ncbi:MAG: hypothetical protein ACXIUQ_12660 [Cecembia sp.]|uniref:Uncharacterized protein n=1 Tax=Indibacter alkaliphilus (strain CCUG 57479 / KCTC 22604 / LW1) TaxID=1189612 RepID=S2DGB5_INDAL|nr:hypothetical protein [Indibacter alkaliphilus]EOZ98102.1 hypothetical protein A33Q_1464 [Indibacter alkaliphilus LW1]
MKIQFKFGNLKGLYVIAYLLLFGGILRLFSGLYDFFKIQSKLELLDKFDFLIQNALLFGLNGLILFLILKWIAGNLKEKNFEVSLK